MTDWILRGGEVIDGTGRQRWRADVAVAGDRIAAGRSTWPRVREKLT
jgi:N-acyl-D-aspartate/D-glutamate deacylase